MLLGIVLLLLEVLVSFEGSREVCREVGLNDLGDGLHIASEKTSQSNLGIYEKIW